MESIPGQGVLQQGLDGQSSIGGAQRDERDGAQRLNVHRLLRIEGVTGLHDQHNFLLIAGQHLQSA